VRKAADGRRPTLRRAPAHERKAPSRTSRSRDRESSEEPPKKRASISKTSGNSIASRGEEEGRGSAAASSASMNLRSGGSTGSGPRGSPEAPRTAPRPAARGGAYGNDLLRRILQGNARGNSAREAPPPSLGRGRGGPGANVLKEIAPPPEEKPAMLKPSTPRERETTRAANPIGRGFGKALQQIASQGERRGR
jgi:hypothetical protein